MEWLCSAYRPHLSDNKNVKYTNLLQSKISTGNEYYFGNIALKLPLKTRKPELIHGLNPGISSSFCYDETEKQDIYVDSLRKAYIENAVCFMAIAMDVVKEMCEKSLLSYASYNPCR